MDAEVDDIKRQIYDANLQHGTVVALVRSGYGWSVHWWTPDGVAPQADYDTPQEALARAAQILDVRDTITPQDWPERVGIG